MDIYEQLKQAIDDEELIKIVSQKIQEAIDKADNQEEIRNQIIDNLLNIVQSLEQ